MTLDFRITEEFKRNVDNILDFGVGSLLPSLFSQNGFIGVFFGYCHQFFTMAGQENFVPTFFLNPAVILQDQKAISDGFTAIKKFFKNSIWSPIGAECYSLFVWGVLGLGESLSEVEVMNVSCF
jgi:hypothetical protein